MREDKRFRRAPAPMVSVLLACLSPVLQGACGSDSTPNGPGSGFVDVAVSMVGSADRVRVGETVTYAITVTNAGTAAAEPVGFTTWLTGADDSREVMGSGWTCQSHTGNFVTCERPSLGAHGSATLTMTRKAVYPGPLVNTVQVDAKAQPDVNEGNNRATATIPVE